MSDYPAVTFYSSYAEEKGLEDGDLVDITFADYRGVEKAIRMKVRVVDDPPAEEGGLE